MTSGCVVPGGLRGWNAGGCTMHVPGGRQGPIPRGFLRLRRVSDSLLQGLGSLGHPARRRAAVFALCCLIVGVVSVHDAALVVVNHQVIGDVEQNPVGKWLLELQGGEVWLFVLVKIVATAFVCAVLVTLYRHSQRLGLLVAGPLAGFQGLLLGYLTFA